jgi:SAM-dependent methyltransferase
LETSFSDHVEWVSDALISARLEHQALLRLLLEKKIIEPQEYLGELADMAADEYVCSVRQFVAHSEHRLRNGRWHIGGSVATQQLGLLLGLGRDDLILDVGCGVGGPARQIAESFGSTVVGIDYRFERIVEATLRTSALNLSSRVSFHVTDAERLPFSEDTFDVVISQGTFNWVPDKAAVVREISRVLKPGGRLGFECEALTEKTVLSDEALPPGLFRILAWQQLLGAYDFEDIDLEQMWDETHAFYASEPEHAQVERGERVNVRMIARKPMGEATI